MLPAVLLEGMRNVECHFSWYPNLFHLPDMVAKTMSLIRLNADFCQPRFDMPRDEFLDGGQRPGELLAYLLQRDGRTF